MTASTRVVIVDDSPFICSLLTRYLQTSDEFNVVAAINNPRRVLDQVRQLKPDVVLLDIDMPGMSGIAVLHQIMDECPVPVVMISGVSQDAARASVQALEIGAVDYIFKYSPDHASDPEQLRRDIVARVRSAAQESPGQQESSLSEASIQNAALHPQRDTGRVEPGELVASHRDARSRPSLDNPAGVIVIGASTGGPAALRQLLSALPPDFPAAILVVQHLPAGFCDALAAQLSRQVALPVRVAVEGDRLRAGEILIAPGDCHMVIRPKGRVSLTQDPEINGHRPAVTLTMESAVQAYGRNTHAVLLSGMGEDGSQGLVRVYEGGGQTYVQEPSSCVVSGMPQRAIETGAVHYIAPPEMLARLLQAECAAPDLEVAC